MYLKVVLFTVLAAFIVIILLSPSTTSSLAMPKVEGFDETGGTTATGTATPETTTVTATAPVVPDATRVQESADQLATQLAAQTAAMQTVAGQITAPPVAQPVQQTQQTQQTQPIQPPVQQQPAVQPVYTATQPVLSPTQTAQTTVMSANDQQYEEAIIRAYRILQPNGGLPTAALLREYKTELLAKGVPVTDIQMRLRDLIPSADATEARPLLDESMQRLKATVQSLTDSSSPVQSSRAVTREQLNAQLLNLRNTINSAIRSTAAPAAGAGADVNAPQPIESFVARYF